MPFNLAEYEPVEDRLRSFWEEYPTGRIATALEHVGADGYIVRAEAYRWAEDVHPTATGYAQEAVTERGVNSTSALENCETSAIGRALANMGYAAKGKRPSREEMAKPARQRASGAPSSASASLPVSSAGGAPEPTSVGGAAQSRETVSSPKVPGGTSAPADLTSGTGAGEAGTATEGNGEGPDVAVPSTNELATADDLANAAKHGLTPTKTKAIAASLGITVTKATELTREQLAAVINRYLEVKK